MHKNYKKKREEKSSSLRKRDESRDENRKYRCVLVQNRNHTDTLKWCKS